MAPDLNSVPASPRHAQPSVAPSQLSISGHSTLPASTTHILSSRPHPQPLRTPAALLSGAGATTGLSPFQPFASLSNPRTPGTTPSGSLHETALPTRHPRLLTAAELHYEVELEQEALVNRLARELGILRAVSASVARSASLTSSTSAHLGSTNNSSGSNNNNNNAPLPHRSSVSNIHGSGQPLLPLQRPRPLDAAAVAPATPGTGTTSAAARLEATARSRRELQERVRENAELRTRVKSLEAELRRLGSSGPAPSTSLALPQEASGSRTDQEQVVAVS